MDLMNSSVSENSASVSPGKPTMTSVVMASSGMAARAACTSAAKEPGVD